MYSIAIDGPAGSGKSTLARALADKLNISYIDTGAMYRALAYKAFKNNLDLCDCSNLENFLKGTHIDYKDGKIYLDKEDVSDKIRSQDISKKASDLSKNQKVRDYLVNIQREISKRRSVVMEGRDIGTVVLPNADLKIFLTASIDIRTRRRYDQLKEKDKSVDFEKLKRDIILRDENDIKRKNSPLKKAEDAFEFDNSNMNLEESINYILDLLRGKNVI